MEKLLYALAAISFVGFSPPTYSSSGSCGSIKSSYYTTPFTSDGYNSKVSWHLSAHRVPEAWELSQGRDITIGQLDTGVHKDQNLLTSSLFNTGISVDRYITRKDYSGTLSIGGWGHGTGVAGVMVSPVNNKGGMTGVAFKSSLVSFRVNEIPALLTNAAVEKFNSSLRKLADRSDVSIINISMGKLKRKSSMEDAIRYAYNKGKLIFASTGITGEDGGVYPAKFNDYVNAVTAVQYREQDPGGSDLQVQFPNPSGSYVDFAVYIKRPSDGAAALVMDKKGYGPCTGIGSSQAAATMSGIAALVWSANPDLTREQVVDILKQSGSYANSPGDGVGYGVVDARKAVELAIAANNSYNKAPSASVSVRSTYPGYSASNVVDGDRNTRVGPSYSWANASGTSASSQYVQLKWDQPVSISRVVLYTSKNYELKNYQVLGAISMSPIFTLWVTLDEVENNISTRVVSNVPQRTYHAIRIRTERGPDVQPQYVRVNELEVY